MEYCNWQLLQLQISIYPIVINNYFMQYYNLPISMNYCNGQFFLKHHLNWQVLCSTFLLTTMYFLILGLLLQLPGFFFALCTCVQFAILLALLQSTTFYAVIHLITLCINNINTINSIKNNTRQITVTLHYWWVKNDTVV